jgi:hypothetical protein
MVAWSPDNLSAERHVEDFRSCMYWLVCATDSCESDQILRKALSAVQSFFSSSSGFQCTAVLHFRRTLGPSLYLSGDHLHQFAVLRAQPINGVLKPLFDELLIHPQKMYLCAPCGPTSQHGVDWSVDTQSQFQSCLVASLGPDPLLNGASVIGYLSVLCSVGVPGVRESRELQSFAHSLFNALQIQKQHLDANENWMFN